MFRYYKILLILSLALSASCDSMKSISSKYNILYNGDLFLNEGLDQLRNSYKDNFWDIIPVIVDNNITNSLPDYPTKNFLKSEEKAIKVIQKMGDSRNSDSNYINDAYLLLGKSRFYDKRYISSLQAFNYILKQDVKSNIWLEAFYWRTLIYINLQQYELAKSSLEKELKDNKISKRNLSLLYDSMSELYYKKRDYTDLIKSLKKAVKYSSSQEQIRRSYFIIAQSFINLNKNDSALVYFQKSIDTKANNFTDIYLDAKLKSSTLKKQELDEDYFNRMLRQPRNLMASSKINYYYALNSYEKGNYNISEIQLKKSLRQIDDDKNLKVLVYNKLFEINLNRKDYLNASNYLDSVLNIIDTSTKDFFVLNKKREKLNSITDLEKQNKLIDSLIYLSTLDSNKLKEVLSPSQNNFETTKDKRTSNKNNLGVFYFNNKTAIENGKKQFKRLWGNRNRIENWRVVSQNIFISEKNSTRPNKIKSNNLETNFFDTKSIPYMNYQKDSLNKIKNYNFFKKGLYLYEYFEDLVTSENNLLKVDPKIVSDNDYLQSRYYLYKIYSSPEFKNNEKSKELKRLILNNYPNSIYAKILNEEVRPANEEFNLEEFFENINLLVDKNRIDRAVSKIDSILPKLSSRSDLYSLYIKKNELQAKVNGIEQYLKSLNELVEMFPEKSIELKTRVQFLKNISDKKSISIEDDSFVLFFVLNKNEKVKSLIDYEYKVDNYNKYIDFLSIYDLSSLNDAESLSQEIIKKNKTLSNNKYFVISTPQYINVLVFKTLDQLKS
jgi:tetratricopeptide (TPR) repeat protein